MQDVISLMRSETSSTTPTVAVLVSLLDSLNFKIHLAQKSVKFGMAKVSLLGSDKFTSMLPESQILFYSLHCFLPHLQHIHHSVEEDGFDKF